MKEGEREKERKRVIVKKRGRKERGRKIESVKSESNRAREP